jgi:hypothetical protein
MSEKSAFTWVKEEISWAFEGKVLDESLVKAGAEAVVNQARVEIAKLTTAMGNGEVTVQHFYDQMKGILKRLHMGEAALARGGFDNMRPSDWARVEKTLFDTFNGVEGKFPGLRSFAEDIQDGRYGTTRLSQGATTRASTYVEAGRGTYENERGELHSETGYDEAVRLLGAVDHCIDCVTWAAMGPMPVREALDKYPICSSVCGGRCHCIWSFRKAGKKWVRSIYEGVDEAKVKQAELEEKARLAEERKKAREAAKEAAKA